MATNKRKKNDKVRDGFLKDLPEKLQTDVMNIHKIIRNDIDELLQKPAYKDLQDSEWVMSCLDKFKVAPEAKGDIGSTRIFRNGKNYKCRIQITDTFRNHQYGWIEDLLNSFINDLYQRVKGPIRRKYDIGLVNNGAKGALDEGFSLELNKKPSEEIWNLWEDKKEKSITESVSTYTEGFFGRFKNGHFLQAYAEDLPDGLRDLITETNHMIYDALISMVGEEKLNLGINTNEPVDPSGISYLDMINMVAGDETKNPRNDNQIGYVGIDKKDNGTYDGIIYLTADITYEWKEFYDPDGTLIKAGCDFVNSSLQQIYEDIVVNFNKENPTKELMLDNKSGKLATSFMYIQLDNDYSEKLWNYIKNPKKYPITEAAELQPDYNKEYNVEMTEKQAKRTLASLSRDIINHSNEKDSKYKVTQYTANIYANIITKNLLPKWAHGYKKFTITLDSYQSFFTFEFKIPTISQDFVSRYIEGREPLGAFLHRVPEIKVKMSPRIFHTMKDPDDAYNFFKAAIKYYDSKIEKCGKSLMSEVMRMNHSLKHLIATTKLSGLVTYPMQLLFVFDDVHMNNPDTFELSESDLKAVNQFMRNIYTRYAAPEKEKKKIVEDVKEMVKSLHEACDMSDNIRHLSYLPEEVQKYLFEGYAKEIKEADDKWMNEQIDFSGMREAKDPQVKIMYEKFGVKKLKKIPSDLVAYITIEAESIRDANDKMMIASYCCSKIEIVEWYIQLLEVGSNKYVVPHTKPWLESMRTQLLACYKKIMAVKVTPPSERPIIDIKYPKGYEG